MVAEHVRSRAMRKDKGTLKGERRINSQLWVEKYVVSVVEEDGQRERERWNRGESCELTI